MSTTTSDATSQRPKHKGTRRPRTKHQKYSRKQPVKKKGFFARLLAFFTPGTKPQSSKNRSQAKSTEVTTSRLYVGNLSYDATESDLFELFNGVGKVQNAEVIINKRTHRSKGFAFVQMQSVEEAKRAVEKLHDKEFLNRKLVVNGAREFETDKS